MLSTRHDVDNSMDSQHLHGLDLPTVSHEWRKNSLMDLCSSLLNYWLLMDLINRKKQEREKEGEEREEERKISWRD